MDIGESIRRNWSSNGNQVFKDPSAVRKMTELASFLDSFSMRNE